MKSLYTLILFTFISTLSIAQTIHVKLIDGSTNKPVSAVKVKSIHDHDFITFSNDSGYFAINLKHNDTILLQKDLFYPVYIGLALHNFDSTHVIQIKLTPSSTVYGSSNQFDKMSLQSFEYHFTHDDVDANSSAKVTIFQSNDALAIQKTWAGDGVKIVSIDVFKASGQKNQYSEKTY